MLGEGEGEELKLLPEEVLTRLSIGRGAVRWWVSVRECVILGAIVVFS